MQESPPVPPGAAAPERHHDVVSRGLRLRVHEWGDPAAAPVLLCHGMFDHGRGFDLFAPLLAPRFRVLALDARGHGESQWADAYQWPADLADIASVLRWLGRPAHLLGHSKGGGQVTDVATLAPELVRQVVNVDGFGPPAEGFARPGGGVDDRGPVELCRDFLDRRRGIARRAAWRAYPDLEDLVERRLAQNPRLSREWLRYFVYHGARRDERGWVWRADPLAGLGFGPFRPAWIAPTWGRLARPLLAVWGSEPDSWSLPEETVAERLARVPRLERVTIPDAGHFIAMEQPAALAAAVLDFLDP